MYICSMFTEKQLKQLQKLFQINNKEVLKAISDSQKDTIKIVGGMISESQTEILIKVQGMITDSQSDTIEVLMDAINTGYNMHDKRIKRPEEELDLSPLKQ